MSEFNKGDRVLVNSRNPTASKLIQIGDIRTVTDTCVDMVRLDNILTGWLFHSNIELVPEDIKPKWSIYNNTLPWGRLTNVKKGELLVADNNGIRFHCFSANGRPKFNICNEVYTAVEPKPVKPEPTMAELFDGDWKECFLGDPATFNERMIAKGWTKPC
jgi:hypothetical protein